MRTTHVYIVPLTGTVVDWGALCGDDDDPIRPVGPAELASKASFDWLDVPDADGDRRVEIKLRAIDPDLGSCLVEVTAHAAFHAHLAANIEGRELADIAADHGRPHLKRPVDAPEVPARLLRMNDV